MRNWARQPVQPMIIRADQQYLKIDCEVHDCEIQEFN